MNIAILNLPGVLHTDVATHHVMRYIEGDACEVVGFDGVKFDVVFGKSVAELVGHVGKRVAFAREVRRLSKSYWIQTPSKYFPIEAHCGMPF
ncbi:MAG: hypothetical protein ACKVP4_02390 [Hyphomicrobium sp.]